MRVYATVLDLPAALREDDTAEDLLERASNIVTGLIRNSVFRVDASGMPTGEVLAACREAVVRQVSTWLSTGVSPLTGRAALKPTAQSKGSNGTTVTYAADPSREAYLRALADGTELTADALSPLVAEGLTTPTVVSSGPARPRMYNPVGG